MMKIPSHTAAAFNHYEKQNIVLYIEAPNNAHVVEFQNFKALLYHFIR